jgi:phenylalanine-4-hydroxylase
MNISIAILIDFVLASNRMYKCLKLMENFVGLKFTVLDKPGSLKKALSVFSEINLSHIQSRPVAIIPRNTKRRHHQFFVHFKGSLLDRNTIQLIEHLKEVTNSEVHMIPPVSAPWFPRSAADLNVFKKTTLDAGDQLECDHPGFHDTVYRKRRTEIAEIARNFQGLPDEKIPNVEYTESEIKTWAEVYSKLRAMYPSVACKEHNDAMSELESHGIFSPNKIPQLQDLSEFLKGRTGFQFRPITGLLSARDFLNALAFRVFFSTQYIRHHSKPMYTPEPDIVHELLGHAPMFLNPDFADFTQYIGLASLGANDEDIMKLATCYWFSVEFGVLRENSEIKAYGAGLLSSFGELSHATTAVNPNREIKEFIPKLTAVQTYPITKMQPIYFASSSLHEAKLRLKEFCDSEIDKNFVCYYEDGKIHTDREVLTTTLTNDKLL